MPIDIDYFPYQGRVDDSALYQSYIPNPPLSHWVQSFWQLDVPHGIFQYRSMPDNCVDWIINTEAPQDNILVTPFLSAIVFELTGPVTYFGIRFRILGHQGLITTPLGEWNRDTDFIDSKDIVQIRSLESVNACLASSHSFKQRCKALSNTLLGLLKEPKIDLRLARYIRYCCANKACNISLSEKQCSGFGLSARQLRRLSQRYLGVAPKAFSRVVRFQHALHLIKTDTNSTHWGDSYCDQSHFIKEFKQISGLTPFEFSKLSVLYNTDPD
jgi:AraC-like DNA-binding protein